MKNPQQFVPQKSVQVSHFAFLHTDLVLQNAQTCIAVVDWLDHTTLGINSTVWCD